MSFTKKILKEHSIKYMVTFIITALMWNPIRYGLMGAAKSGKLESIAVVMGIIVLCSLTGYFAFSYTAVGKKFVQRFFGYLCTFFLGISLILSLIVIYFIAAIWVPSMALVWGSILFSLYIGTVIFDNLDLLRMGLDVFATSYFEKGHLKKSEDELSAVIQFLKEGQRLEFANSLIGQGIIKLGEDKKDLRLQKAGKSILDQSDSSQHEIDRKVAETFSVYAKTDLKIRDIVTDLKKGQSQSIADSLIVNLLEIVKEK